MKKRFLAMVMTFTMCFSLFPSSVWASSPLSENDSVIETESSDSDDQLPAAENPEDTGGQAIDSDSNDSEYEDQNSPDTSEPETYGETDEQDNTEEEGSVQKESVQEDPDRDDLETEVDDEMLATSGTCGDNLTWTMDADGLVTISGTGAMKTYSNYVSKGRSPWYQSTSVTGVVVEDGVTSISPYAFYKCTNLTSVDLGSTVQTVGTYAFYWCEALESLTLSPALTAIDDYAYSHCTALATVSSLKNTALSTIGVSAFSNCSAWGDAIELPDTITSVGNNAFQVTPVREIYIPDVDVTLGTTILTSKSTIYGYTGSTAETYVSSTTYYTFVSLKPAAVTNLKAVEVDRRTIKVSWTASAGAQWYKIYRAEGTETTYYSKVRTNGTSYTDSGLITGTTYKYIVIPESDFLGTTYQGVQSSSVRCSLIVPSTEITSDDVTDGTLTLTWTAVDAVDGYHIYRKAGNGEYVLYASADSSSTSWTDSDFETDVEYSYRITAYYDTLESDYSNEISVTPVSSRAPIVKSGTCGDNLTWTLDEDGLLVISGTGPMTTYSNMQTKGRSPWFNSEEVSGVVIEDGVTSISPYAFYQCDNLILVEMGADVESVGTEAFYYCDLLYELELSPALTTIDTYAFSHCPHLELVSNLKDTSLSVIGQSAFSECSGWEGLIELPDTITSVGDYAFNGTASTEVYVPDTDVTLGTGFISSGSTLYGYSGSTAQTFCTGTNFYTFACLNAPAPSSFTTESVDRQTVSLSWDKVFGVKKYVIFRGTGSDMTEIATTTGTSYTDKGLQTDVEYSYRVYGMTEYQGLRYFGTGSTVEKSTPHIKTPAIPSVSMTPKAVTLNWSSVDEIEGYHIYRKAATESAFSLYDTVDSSVLTWQDTNADINVNYTYYVAAYYEEYSSDNSNEVNITPVINTPSLTLNSYSVASVKLSWKEITDVGGYYIYRKEAGGSWDKIDTINDSTVTSWTDTGYAINKTYSYRITAFYKTFESDNSAEVNADTTLRAPSITSIYPDLSRVKIAWTTITDVDGYDLYRKYESGAYKKIYSTNSSSTNSYTDSYAENGKTYTYYLVSRFNTEVSVPGTAKSVKASSICHTCGGNGLCSHCNGVGCIHCSGFGYLVCDTLCSRCSGSGTTYTGATCLLCGGSGNCSKCDGTGQVKCSYCNGSGQCSYCKDTDTCNICSGAGYIDRGYIDPESSEQPESTDVVIVNQPQNYRVGVKHNAVFTVSAENAASYQWQYSKNGTTWYNSSSTGAKTDTLTIAVKTTNYKNIYRCKITGVNKDVVYSDTATVDLIPGAKITAQPSSVCVTSGEKAAFTLAADNATAYQWYYSKDGGTSWFKSTATGASTNTFSVTVSSSNKNNLYRCKITGTDENTLTSTAVGLVIIAAQPENSTVAIGETGTFTVKADADNPIDTYKWYYSKDSGTTWYTSSATGSDTETLSVKAASSNRANLYRCKVTNIAGISGWTSAVGFTDSAESLVITKQPVSVSAAVGEKAVFTVTAENVAATGGYQWYYSKDGKTWYKSGASGNAANTLTVTVTTANKANQYKCKITGKDGSVKYTDIVTAQ